MDMESMTGMVMSAAETAVSATMTMSGMDHSGMDHSGMDHSGMNHGSDANSTAAASGGGGGGHGSMEHVPGTCRISMLWNWYTIDSCFLARSWHVTSAGEFAISCIGVVLLVISLEMVRRVQREYDGYLRLMLKKRNGAFASCGTGAGKVITRSSSSEDGKPSHDAHIHATPLPHVSKLQYFKSRKFLGPPETRVKLYQHIIRSFFYMVQFAVAYIVMLLAMYFNGYIIICIYIGAFLGAFIFQWDNLMSEQREPCCG